ncbi:MAG: YgiT-type zinc finger protein [Dehalococcoidia bacterium]
MKTLACHCGGDLRPALLNIQRKIKGLTYTLTNVPGFRCDVCGDELISPQVAHGLRERLTFRANLRSSQSEREYEVEETPIVDFEEANWNTRLSGMFKIEGSTAVHGY